MNNNLTKWDLEFIKQAKFISERSKDKNTKTGVVIVDNENTEIVSGYNKFPRGADDTDQRRYERPTKYVWFEHAERSAIYKAARLGISVNGCKMYATYFPCVDCARAIIESGLTKLYTEKPDFNHEKWGHSWVDALIMLKECGVEVIWTNDEETKWLAQWLEGEWMWYLSELHDEDGIRGEHFFKTREDVVEYIIANGLKVDFTDECENAQCSFMPCRANNECEKESINGSIYCKEHDGYNCRCGEQAVTECWRYAGSFVCGQPLCERCNKSHNH